MSVVYKLSLAPILKQCETLVFSMGIQSSHHVILLQVRVIILGCPK